MREEQEQFTVDSSVSLDFTNCRAEAFLPFMEDPAAKLVPNRDRALKVYKQQDKEVEQGSSCQRSCVEIRGQIASSRSCPVDCRSVTRDETDVK